MKSRLKLLNTRQSSAGFTLIELLVAAAISTIVIGVSGFGLVTIMGANQKAEAETERRANLNRGLDFISDEVRTAINVSSTAPAWAWTGSLGGGSPAAKLYVQIPLQVNSMAATGKVTVSNHEFTNVNAVMFTGTGTPALPLLKNVVYYVRDRDANTFNVSATLGGIAIPLVSNSTGSLTANRLVIYYIRTNTSTWLPPKTVNRSAGPCTDPYAGSNCPALVDSIAADGFTASVVSSRQAELHLIGKLSGNSTKTYEVSTKVFARSVP